MQANGYCWILLVGLHETECRSWIEGDRRQAVDVTTDMRKLTIKPDKVLETGGRR